MGFCLAQLGLNLVMPKTANDVVSVWGSATFFITAFIFIALLWWLHHRTFSAFFVPNTPMIVMNFGVLCSLILTLYFFESVVHVAGAGQPPDVFLNLFALSFAVVYLLLGAMLLVGLLLRRSQLPVGDLRWGITQLTTIAITILFFICAAFAAAHHVPVLYAAAAAYVLVFVIRRIVLPRWLRSAVKEAI